jgi:inosine/xanthosine triphosphate pyrophosphatase family protein
MTGDDRKCHANSVQGVSGGCGAQRIFHGVEGESKAKKLGQKNKKYDFIFFPPDVFAVLIAAEAALRLSRR